MIQGLWRNLGLWAVVLGFVGLGAMLMAASACAQNNEEGATRAFWADVVALAAEVAALTLGIKGWRQPGAGLGLIVGVLALLGSLFIAALALFGVCSGSPI